MELNVHSISSLYPWLYIEISSVRITPFFAFFCRLARELRRGRKYLKEKVMEAHCEAGEEEESKGVYSNYLLP